MIPALAALVAYAAAALLTYVSGLPTTVHLLAGATAFVITLLVRRIDRR